MELSTDTYRGSEVGSTQSGRQKHDQVKEFLSGDATSVKQRRRFHALPLGQHAHHELHQAYQREREEHAGKPDEVAVVRAATFHPFKLDLRTEALTVVSR